MIDRWREALTGFVPVAVLTTWACCALPLLLVAIGAGSVMASLLSAAPWLAELSRHKEWFFAATGLLLVANWWALYRSGPACEPGGVCHPSHPLGRWLRRVYWASVALYGVGLGVTFLTLPVLRLLEG